VPGPGGPDGPLGITRRWFLRGGGGGQGLPPPPAEAESVHQALPIPAGASRAYRPNPQATTKLAPHPSSLKGSHLRGTQRRF